MSFLSAIKVVSKISSGGVFTIIPPNGSDYQLRFYDDDRGQPGTMLWEGIYNPTLTDTGDDWHSGNYDIYHLSVTLDPVDYFIAEDATPYWLALYIPSGDVNVLWAVWYGGNIHYTTNDGGSWTNWGRDGMFRLNGTDNYSAIEETTWGQLKTAHSIAD